MFSWFVVFSAHIGENQWIRRILLWVAIGVGSNLGQPDYSSLEANPFNKRVNVANPYLTQI